MTARSPELSASVIPGAVPEPGTDTARAVVEPQASPAPSRRAGWLPLCLSVAAFVSSAFALVFSLGREPTPPPPILVSMPADVPASLIGVELLLPHLPRSQPFPRPFAVAKLLAAGDAEVLALLATLGGAAREGAPTQRHLIDSFPAVADAAVLVEMGFAADAGWLARRAAGAMRIGVALGSNGSPVLAAMDAVSIALGQADLTEAERILRELDVASPPALITWRATLERRVAAYAATLRLATLARDRAEALTPSLSARR